MDFSRKALSGWVQVGIGVILLQLALGWMVALGVFFVVSGAVLLLRAEPRGGKEEGARREPDWHG